MIAAQTNKYIPKLAAKLHPNTLYNSLVDSRTPITIQLQVGLSNLDPAYVEARTLLRVSPPRAQPLD